MPLPPESRNSAADLLEDIANAVRDNEYGYVSLVWSDGDGSVRMILVPGGDDDPNLAALVGVQRLSHMIETAMEAQLHSGKR